MSRASTLLGFVKPRGEALAATAAIASVNNSKAAKIASNLKISTLANAIKLMINKEIKISQPVANAAFNSLSKTNKKSDTVKQVLILLSNSLQRPIPVNPIINNSNPKLNVNNAINKHVDPNLANHLLHIIKLSTKKTEPLIKIIKNTPKNNLPREIKKFIKPIANIPYEGVNHTQSIRPFRPVVRRNNTPSNHPVVVPFNNHPVVAPSVIRRNNTLSNRPVVIPFNNHPVVAPSVIHRNNTPYLANQPLVSAVPTRSWVSERPYLNQHPKIQTLPIMEQNAIRTAGGVHSALTTISSVPGGAPELVRAIRTPNLTTSPQVVNTIRKFGGSVKTIQVLNGLNTLASTRITKKTTIRLAELNKVIKTVLKRKLISLVAHNIKKNHNLHPKNFHKKMYYQKAIKSLILNTPFSKIVRKASKKKRVRSSI